MHRSYRSTLMTGALLALATLGPARPLAGQQQPLPADSVRAELARLQTLIDSLRSEVDRLRVAGQEEEAGDALADLRAAAQAAAAAGGGGAEPQDQDEQQFVGRQRSLQALNPEISLTGDVLAQVVEGDPGEDNFFPREFELSIISNLDPFSRAKVFLARHVPGGEIVPFDEEGHGHEEGAEIGVEEGYVEWVSLPGGLGLKVGRFYQQFGQLNRWHAHAYPFQSRSLPSLTFIGEEPLSQTGASVRWLLPVGGDAGTYTLTGEVTRSENETLFGTSSRPSVLGNVNAFWVLSPSLDLDLSASWINGTYEDQSALLDRDLYGLEMSLTWRPPEASRYRGLNVRAGAMKLDGLVAEDGTLLAGDATGFWALAENRLSQSWLVGGRLDWTENPHDPEQTAWLLSPTLTWWQSEYVRVRGEYDLLGRDDARQGRFLLQVTFSMGPHKHETY